MKKLQFTGKLIRHERLENSEYGNPKYFGVFKNEKGDILKAANIAWTNIVVKAPAMNPMSK